MFFGAIRSVTANVAELGKPKNISILLEKVLEDKTIQAQVLDLNTKDQLYNKGIDTTGTTLGDYSPFTTQYKAFTGQRYDHITLNDTGEFYRSFRFVNQKSQFKIAANTIKEGNDDLLDRFPDIIGLTNENIGELANMVQGPFKEGVLDYIR